jgi:hypothetical protein
MVIRPKSIATVVVALSATGVDVVDADAGRSQVLLGAQRRDLAERADHRGLAHAEAARDQDLDGGGRRRGGGAPPVRVVVVHLAPPEEG